MNNQSPNPQTYMSYLLDSILQIHVVILFRQMSVELMTEFKSKIIFTQEDSGKEVELILYNDKDGIKKAD